MDLDALAALRPSMDLDPGIEGRQPENRGPRMPVSERTRGRPYLSMPEFEPPRGARVRCSQKTIRIR
jgi:hypothetical protein